MEHRARTVTRAEAAEMLAKIRAQHDAERMAEGDGLNFWRGLLIAIPAGLACWGGIAALIRWAI